MSYLTWGNPQFGIYDRYGDRNSKWFLSGPCSNEGVPNVGQYFATDEPVRVTRKGKDYDFIQRKKSINDKK